MFQKFVSGADNSAADVVLSADAQGGWILPDTLPIFTSEFARDGRDLLMQTEDGTAARLVGFFSTQETPDLVNGEGAMLRGSVVDRLAGPLFPGQYAQAGGIDLAAAIGQVETLTGAAFVQRTDGSTEELQIGTKVFQGDVVRTDNGGVLGLTFADGTIFTLASGSRMVLDELIYDPQSTANSGVFNLVEGSFVFIAGQAAKTGGIEISTPAATMGIRGTTGVIDIQTTNGILRVSVSLDVDPDGGRGVIDLFDLSGNQIASITETDTKWIIASPISGEPPLEVARDPADEQGAEFLLSQALSAFQSAVARVQQGETFVEFSEGEGEGQDDTTEDGETEGDEGSEGGDPIVPPPLDETGDGDGDDGESGGGNPELDGTDDALPEGDEGGSDQDDAFLDTGTETTETASNSVNAPPQFSDEPIQSVEDTPLTGSLPVTDREGDEIQVSLTRGAENGLVILASDGTFTYTPNDNFEGTDSFEVTAVDSEGATSEAEITVVVDAVNDAPVVTFERQVAVTAETREGEQPDPAGLSGVLEYDDVDEGDVPGVWSIAAADDNATALGSIDIDGISGAWTYVLDQTAANALAENQEVVESFVATVTDSEGATAVSLVEITITGTNDGPVLTSSVEQTEASLAEAAFGFVLGEGEPDAGDDDAPGSVTGTLTYDDADQGDTPGQWTIAANPENATALGAIAIDALTGTWVYTLDESAADVLGNDDTVVEVFTATITDAFGATASQTVTVTVTGFNDAPTITFSIEDIEATVFEAGFVPDDGAFGEASLTGEPDATGTLRYVDPDGQPGETATWTVSPDGPALGSMTIDAATGAWEYFLDEDAAQGLKDGEEVVETFTAIVTDGLGASSSQVITITVIGSNDEAEIQADPQDLQGNAAEDGVSTASGQLSFVDADADPGDVATWTVAPDGQVRGSMTIDPITGAWDYTLDQANAQSLGEGEVGTDVFIASVTDSLGAVATQTITIFLAGENDAPVVTSAAVSETVQEDGASGPGIPSVSGTLTFTDVDVDASVPFWTVVPDAANQTVLGALSVDPTSGDWSYVLDQGAADALENGDVVTERFTATITDAFGASDDTTIEITIQGSNDAPVLTSATLGLTEEEADVSIDLTTLATDVDAGDTPANLTYAIVSGPAAGSASLSGSEVIFETDGAFTALALNETQDVEIVVSATDAAGASDTAVITVTVTGSNGAPTLAATSRTVSEDGPNLNINLISLGDDPDADEDGSTLNYSIATSPSEGTASISGTTLTFAPGPDFEDLGNGESRDVSVGIVATDNAGETASAFVTITVTGSNDAPIITGGVTSGSAVEPGDGISGTTTASGTLSYTDADETSPGDGVWSISPASSALGQMAIGAGSGTWTYTLNAAAADALTAGETRTETFTAKVTDAGGDSDTQVVTITITGSNDAPTVSAASETLSENDGSVQINLAALGADVDAGETGSTLDYAIAGAPSAGSASISGNTLTFAVGEDFADLGEDDSRDVTVRIIATDSEGATGEGVVTITVTGTNDAPVITSSAAAATGAVTEPGDGTSGSLTTGGTLTYDDPDASTPTSGQWSVSPLGTALGSISINAVTGVWEYTLDADAADPLDVGDQVTEVFVATIEDEQGATDEQEITVTITGTNDAPTLDGTSRDTTEDATTVNIDLAALADDVDADDTATSLIFSIEDQPNEGSASIISGRTLRFTLGEDFQGLAEGDEEIITIGIEVRDSAGATATQDIEIVVEGTNDGPVITSSAAAARGTVVDPGTTTAGVLTVSGTLTYFDVDETASNQGDWSVTPSARTFGEIEINQTTGVWTYTLNEATANALNAGETRTENFTATVEDEEGATATQIITITIQGTNDAPTISGTSREISDSDPSVSIALAGLANDPDAGEPAAGLMYDVVSNPANGTAQISGSTLQFFTNGDFASLGDAETETVSIGVRVRDAAGAEAQTTIDITVTGTNDAPIITSNSAAAQGDVIEEGTIEFPSMSVGFDAFGQLTYSDVDEGENPGTWTIVPTSIGNFGTMTIGESTGRWEYTLNQSLADSLYDGEEVTETYIATITDSEGATDTQIVTINITGTNDDPVVSATSPVSVSGTEGVEETLSGTLSVNDVDDQFASGPSWSIVPAGESPPTYGSMTISGSGGWSYAIDDEATAELMQGEVVSETYRAEVTDEFGATDFIDVTVEITGVNTAPTIDASGSGLAGNLVEAGVSTPGIAIVFGDLVYTDPDEGETGSTWSFSSAQPGVFGDFALNENTGRWTYTLNNSDADVLNDGQVVTESVNVIASDVFVAGSAPQTITVSITGTNDAPTLTQSGTILVDQDDPTDVNLVALADDPDAEHTAAGLIYSVSTDPAKGLATISNGVLTFDPNDEFAALGGSGFEDVAIGVTVSDGAGGTTTETITVRVAGENDAPVITSTPADAQRNIEERGESTPASDLTVSGTLTYSDADEGAGPVATWSVNPLTSPFGSIAIGETTGVWTYTLDQAAADQLDEGDPVQETFTATVEDAMGASATQIITIDIVGANDTPVLTGTTTPVSEDGPFVSVELPVRASDVDADDTPASLAYSVVSTTAGSASIVGDDLRFDPGTDFEDLGVGDTATATVVVQVSDGDAQSTANFLFTVTGANDAPVITSLASDAQGSITESSTGFMNDPTVSGTLTYDDVDEGAEEPAGWSIDAPLTSPFGEIAINAGTGEWTYTLNQSAADVLDAGDTAQETFTARVTDLDGGDVTQTITIDITGTNDVPLLAGGSDTVLESGEPLEFDLPSGASDVDGDDTVGSLTFFLDNVFGDGLANVSGGTLTFSPNMEFESLGRSATDTVTVAVGVQDTGGSASPGLFQITIQGENDRPIAPDFAVNYTGTGGGQTIDVLAQASDIDVGDVLSITSFSTSGDGTVFLDLGTMPVDPSDDTLFYTPDSGFTGTETVFYTVSDGLLSESGEITVTVPNNDVAPVAQDDTGAATLVSFGAASEFATNGHFYEFVRGYYNWDNANTDAASKGGYLATITSIDENLFGGGLLAAAGGDIDAWLGGSDVGDEGKWFWNQGPESGDQFFEGNATTGSAQDGSFVNWAAGQPDPNSTTQDFLVLSRFTAGDHPWDDAIGSDPRGYLLEYDEVALVTGDVSTNDSDANAGDVLNYFLDDPGAAPAGFTLNGDGSWTFDTTVGDFAALEGGDTQVFEIVYIVEDQTELSDQATLTLTLTGANDAPVVVDQTVQLVQEPGTGWTEFEGHFYRSVSGLRSWSEATELAGQSGAYLANITSQAENDFVDTLFAEPVAWIGGTDAAVEGAWRWSDGPEENLQFWSGTAAPSGMAVGGNFANFASGEPLAARAAGQDHLVIRNGGDWDDLANDPIEFSNGFYNFAAHIEEFSGVYRGNLNDNVTDPEGDSMTFALSGTYAGLSLDGQGNWEFNALDPAYDSLISGETAFINAYYIATDASGASANGRLRIEVAGANNAPTVQPTTVAGLLSEDSGTVSLSIVDDIIPLLGADDVDSDDNASSLTYSFSNFVTDIISVTSTNIIFTLGNDFQSLDTGDSSNLTLDVTVTDQHGASDTEQLTVVVSGVNDAPVVYAINAGSVDENAGIVMIDLLAGQTDVDTGDVLSVTNFNAVWSGDGPSPSLFVNASGVVNVNAGDFASLNSGEAANLAITYNVFDGTVGTANTASLTVTGVGSPPTLTALGDDLRPGGNPNTDEDIPFTFAISDLLINDMPDGTGPVQFESVPQYSVKGASLFVSGGNISYNPWSSATLNDLNDGDITTDAFLYTITNGAGTETDFANVTVGISGLDQTDNDPIENSIFGAGFSNSSAANEYIVNPSMYKDDDKATGIVYKFGEGAADDPLPSYLKFDPSSYVLTVDQATHTPSDAGLLQLTLSAFEADGDYAGNKFLLVTDTDGEIDFTINLFNTEATFEFGLDGATPMGDIGSGEVVVDLEVLSQISPTAFDDITRLDFKNDQENKVPFDPNDLLALIAGNGMNANEQFELTLDSFDQFAFSNSSEWVVTQTGSGAIDTYEISDAAASGGVFDSYGLAATFLVDDGATG